MRTNNGPALLLLAALLPLTSVASVYGSELDDVKAAMRVMQENMAQMQKKIVELERENQKKPHTATSKPAAHGATTTAPANPPSYIDANGNQVVTIAPEAVTIESHASEVTKRDSMNDQQEAAPRPNDLTLDPKYRGFIPIPNTGVLVKFNAKPRVDFTDDPQNTGNPDRFVTAQIPVTGEFFKGGGNQFNVNSKG